MMVYCWTLSTAFGLDRPSTMATSAFAVQRAKRVNVLAKALHKVLVERDGGVFLARTGALIRGRSLRSKENKSIFSKILGAFPVESFDDSGTARIWTKRLFKDSLDKLVKDYQLEFPRLPGFSYSAWLEDQANLLQTLAKKAKRNTGNPSRRGGSSSSVGSMDTNATLQFDSQDSDLYSFGWSCQFAPDCLFMSCFRMFCRSFAHSSNMFICRLLFYNQCEVQNHLRSKLYNIESHIIYMAKCTTLKCTESKSNMWHLGNLSHFSLNGKMLVRGYLQIYPLGIWRSVTPFLQDALANVPQSPAATAIESDADAETRL